MTTSALISSRSRWLLSLTLSMGLWGLTWDACAKDDSKPAKENGGGKKAEASTAFFAANSVPNLKLELPPSEMESLRKDARTYVKCKVVENDSTTFTDVAIKLKGAAGSFQEIDQRPAFTINMDRFTEDQSFHGLDKFHLNNSVQDETYLHELLCSSLFNEAGIPAPRVAHARVWLNGKDLGLYVLKEGFDKNFLKQHFTNSKGNLYDGGFLNDVDAELDRDEGKGVENRTDLVALAEACRLEQLDQRWPRLEELLNVEQFITFMALEFMTGHWDGYCLNQNNYRLYFDPGDKNRAHFLPHGMDQMFGDPGASILNAPKALVASAVMQNPAWRQLYREKIKNLLPMFSPADALKKKAESATAKLKPALASLGGEALKQHQERLQELLERLTARAASLKEQSESPEPQPLAFDEKGHAELDNWVPRQETGEAQLEDINEDGKPRLLLIGCGDGEETIASWRTSVLLAPGNYRFEGKAKSKDLKALETEKGSGGGLRISGENRTNKKQGTGAWSALQYEFTVDSERQVELVAELRAKKGQLWFDAKSLRLVKQKPTKE
jgi:spore coat protein H